jgi:hypothetical protein
MSPLTFCEPMLWGGTCDHTDAPHRSTTTLADPPKRARCDKRGYRSEVAARDDLHDAIRKSLRLTHRREQRIYLCPTCDRWHLTSKPLLVRSDP